MPAPWAVDLRGEAWVPHSRYHIQRAGSGRSFLDVVVLRHPAPLESASQVNEHGHCAVLEVNVVRTFLALSSSFVMATMAKRGRDRAASYVALGPCPPVVALQQLSRLHPSFHGASQLRLVRSLLLQDAVGIW